MTDREMLELAALAAGLDRARNAIGCGIVYGGGIYWNPLSDDGDALRLAVKLKFHINIFPAINSCDLDLSGFVEIWENGDSDPLRIEYVKEGDYDSSTRRAITRAAAEIGKQMKASK